MPDSVLPGPATDMVASPPTDSNHNLQSPPPPTQQQPAPNPADHTSPPSPKVAKPQRTNGVAGAIFATVVIVIVLAALAVYAYLKQTRG